MTAPTFTVFPPLLPCSGTARLLSEAFLLPLLMGPRSLVTGSFEGEKKRKKKIISFYREESHYAATREEEFTSTQPR